MGSEPINRVVWQEIINVTRHDGQALIPQRASLHELPRFRVVLRRFRRTGKITEKLSSNVIDTGNSTGKRSAMAARSA
jgi:hypothetical protein